MRQAKLGRFPYPLGAAVLLVQVALGITIFAGFQEFVPNYVGTGDDWPGYLLGAYGAARFLAETPTGALNDRLERKLGLLIGFSLMAPAVAVMALLQRPWQFLLASAALGAGTAFLWPATYAITADLYPPEQRGRIVGFLNFAQLAGFGTGALAGAFLLPVEPRGIFVLGGGAVVLAFVAALRYVPAYRHERLFALAPRLHTSPWRALRSRHVLAVSGLIVLGTTSLGAAIPAIRPYGEQQLGVSFETLTVALIPSIVVGTLAYVPAGHTADRRPRWQPLAAGQLLAAAGLLALGATDALPVAAAIALFVFLGNVFSVPAWNAAMMDLAPPERRGMLVGLAVAVSGLGLTLGPVLGGTVVEHFGPLATFRASAVLSVATAAAAAAYGLRLRPPHPAVVVRHEVEEVS